MKMIAVMAFLNLLTRAFSGPTSQIAKFGARCDNIGHVFKIGPDVTLNKCIEECERKPWCKAIGYRRHFNLCNIYTQPYDAFSSESLSEKTDCVVVLKSSMDSPLLSECNSNCGLNQTSFTACKKIDNTLTCIAEECPPLELYHGQVFGNMNNHGSRKLVTCEPGYKLIGDSIVTCNYGQWSGDPMCVEETVSTPPEPVQTTQKEQWVSRIRAFSSEWSSEYWSAKQVIGPPNVYPQYLDSPSAWSIGKNKLNSRTEFLELVFTKPVIVKRVDIYETFNSGSVTSLEGLHLLDDNWVILWSTVRAQHIKAARIFSPQLNVTNVFTNVIRINMDASVSQSYVEIDAVQLVGT